MRSICAKHTTVRFHVKLYVRCRSERCFATTQQYGIATVQHCTAGPQRDLLILQQQLVTALYE